MNWAARSLVWMIQIYRWTISLLLPGQCRFTPSCAEYTQIALRERGFWPGLYFGARRILRCQPFCQGGEDHLLKGCH